jgi:hypothetical protein
MDISDMDQSGDGSFSHGICEKCADNLTTEEIKYMVQFRQGSGKNSSSSTKKPVIMV